MIKKNLAIFFVFLIFTSILISAENNSNNFSEKIENNSILKEKVLNCTNPALSQKDEEDQNSSSSFSFNESKNINGTEEIKEKYIDLDKILNESKIENSTKNQTKNESFYKKIEKTNEKNTPPQNQNNFSKEEKQNTTKIIQEEIKKINLKLYKEGKKEIEGKIPENFNAEIKKEEKEISQNKKEVIVKSEKHLESELIVYSDITETKKKEDIGIIWKNENKKIDILEYLDTNHNGLIDRISWKVPHLSEQIFEITIDSSFSTESKEMLLYVENPPEGVISNPVSFNWHVNYSEANPGDMVCKLKIDNPELEGTTYFEEITPNTQEKIYIDLANGEYFWNLSCVDTFSGPQYSNFTTGNFTVEEKNFTVSLEYPPIFLDSEDIEFNVETPHNSDYSGKLIYPNGETKILSTNQDKIDSSWLTQVGEYTLNLTNNYFENEIFRTIKFDVIKANIISYYSEIEKNELAKIKFSFDSNSPGKEITDILANFKDGNKKDIETNKEITHNYTSSGNYKIEVSFKFAGSPFSVLSENIEVTDPEEDNEAPSLNLIYPKNNEIIKEDTITFKYEVGDDGTIKQCEYQLFKKTDDTGIYEDEYVTTDKSIELNTEQQIKLTSFEDGDYRWDINCEDNYGEEVLKKQYFTVKTTKHEYEDEIDEALDNLDSFLEKEESYSMDTKEFLDKIGISEDLTYYKKRLLQIDQDLGTNIKFITNENLKKERTEETIEELNEIEKNIPKEINIIDSSEFIKNSLIDLEEITKEYVEGKNILLSSREIKKLAEKNKGIQENLGTTTKIKIAEIKYVDSIEKITLVTKKIDLISEEYETIIEKIPNTIENIEFQTESKEINKNLFEIKIKDIENKEISYVIREETSIDKLKESETILFEEFPIEGFSFTGYSIIGDIGETSPSHWILIVIATLVILYFSKEFLKKNNLKKWKKEENVRTILEYSSKAKKFLQENNTENAKECYHKIKEIYNLTPEKFRNHIFPVIKNIQIGINKREIQEFVKEYENAKRERRENDAKILYRNIQENYKKLPKIYQEKIYERIIKKNENFSL